MCACPVINFVASGSVIALPEAVTSGGRAMTPLYNLICAHSGSVGAEGQI